MKCENCGTEMRKTTPEDVGFNICEHFCPICGLTDEENQKIISEVK